MKGLRKYLTPFAPDQSGAVSVLYELGGILVICDAGGCVGNICGFDEPRWQKKKSAVFSAGLRDMDAIMGRDELLIRKLELAAQKIDAKFVAIIGTPVPAVIGTDFHALRKMAERKLKLPVLSIDTNGMDLYDKGEEKAYLELLAQLLKGRTDAIGEPKATEEPSARLGIWGCTPLAMSNPDAGEKLKAYYREKGYENVIVYGCEGSFEDFALADRAEKNIVVSPSGLAPARYLEKKFGIPFETEDPLSEIWFGKMKLDRAPRKALIVGQQIAANQLRRLLMEQNSGARISVASWFSLDKGLALPGDLGLKEEDQFEELVCEGSFDLIIGDPVLKEMLGNFEGRFIEKAEFALSGKGNYFD